LIDKIIEIAVYLAVVVMALLMLPYLLYLEWVRIIALKRQASGLDFDCRGSKL